MRRHRLAWASVWACCAGAWGWGGYTGAVAASFPCAQARSAVEKTICASPELSQLDEHLARYFQGLKLHFRHAPQCLTQAQRAWLKQVRDACADASCLRQAYLQRLAEWHAVQPGVSALKQLPLPAVSPLVWVVPPAADEVAAPRHRPTSPLSLTGRIVNDIADGDGLVLQTAQGHKHVIVPSMLLDEPSTSALIALAKAPEARYLVQGQAEPRAATPQAFSAGHCTWIHRVQP